MSMVDYKNKKNKRNQSESDKKTTLKKDPSLRIKRRVLERLSLVDDYDDDDWLSDIEAL